MDFRIDIVRMCLCLLAGIFQVFLVNSQPLPLPNRWVPKSFHGVPRLVFDVTRYGAMPNQEIDSSEAFLRAWKDACKTNGWTIVRIPRGTYLVETVSFEGPCNGPIMVDIKGVLVAPTDPFKMFGDTWIAFRNVDNLEVCGGVLDGRGPFAWKYKDCNSNSGCRTLPATLRLNFVTNSKIRHLKSINSKSVHINVFACNNLLIAKIGIEAPKNSPNTDGIHIGISHHIAIQDAYIGTGDDCIAMVAGSKNIKISRVTCGPGHGISIGSLGRGHEDEYVDHIIVRNSTLISTDNGLRIKTWAPSSPTLASNIFFDDIVMKYVNNPIIINQRYCPWQTCPQADSLVQLENVMFRNIWGISNTEIAVNLQCSRARPCKNVKMVGIDMWYGENGNRALANCSNVLGYSYGRINPNGCL